MSDVRPLTPFPVILSVSVAVLCIAYTWQGEAVGLVGDDAIYLLMADYFSPYDSAARAGAAFIMKFSGFPPLYPALLAVAGAGSRHILLAHWITALCIIFSAALYWYWLVKEGVGRHFALLMSGLFLSLPGTMILALDLWSEHLYLALTLLNLLLARHAGKTGRGWLGVAVTAGLVPLTRSAGLTFLVATWAFFIIHKAPDRWRLIAASVVPMFAWTLISLPFKSYVSYKGIFGNFFSVLTFSDLLPVMEFQMRNLWQGWHKSFDFQAHNYSVIAPALLLFAVPVGWWGRLKEARLDALYLPPYLVLIALWPSLNQMTRFLYVIMPFLLYYGFAGFGMMMKKYTTPGVVRMLRMLFLALIVFSCAPSTVQILSRRMNPPAAGLAAYAGTATWVESMGPLEGDMDLSILKHFATVFREEAKYVEPDQCVLTAYPERFMFYARRLAFPLPTLGVNQEEFDRGMSRCRYVQIFWLNTHPYYPPAYPLNRLKQQGKLVFVSKMSNDSNAPPVTGLLRLR
ncbi:MAG TPA: hypothetical protein VMH34_01415 [Gammaproteobacteria bacterium]|nr:hypothetical protein [Gammaproteobacteria bacterium]